jgi:hypothetical protein
MTLSAPFNCTFQPLPMRSTKVTLPLLLHQNLKPLPQLLLKQSLMKHRLQTLLALKLARSNKELP